MIFRLLISADRSKAVSFMISSLNMKGGGVLFAKILGFKSCEEFVVPVRQEGESSIIRTVLI